MNLRAGRTDTLDLVLDVDPDFEGGIQVRKGQKDKMCKATQIELE